MKGGGWSINLVDHKVGLTQSVKGNGVDALISNQLSMALSSAVV